MSEMSSFKTQMHVLVDRKDAPIFTLCLPISHALKQPLIHAQHITDKIFIPDGSSNRLEIRVKVLNHGI
jgi:hypothetical protein